MKLPIALLAAALGLATAADLGIETTHAVECERKSKAGDAIEVHYHGTFADSGDKFDSSFDRKKPLGFTLGSGRVIKGFVLRGFLRGQWAHGLTGDGL
ncbi:FKBP-type peptidyl-prolyl cis-trans isomerase [Candidatus Bathyarchaeota archaeon]|nr:FKBP-type peptidyl-prolyl cis-trans isomerase [Candidatus Bathyarchaeota archaeon]